MLNYVTIQTAQIVTALWGFSCLKYEDLYTANSDVA